MRERRWSVTYLDGRRVLLLESLDTTERKVLARAWELGDNEWAWQPQAWAWTLYSLTPPESVQPGRYWLAKSAEAALHSIERWIDDLGNLPPPDVQPEESGSGQRGR